MSVGLSSVAARHPILSSSGMISKEGTSPTMRHNGDNANGVIVFEVDDASGAKSNSLGPQKLQRNLGRTIFRNFTLIGIWYFFSTLLSVYNKKLMGTNSSYFGNEKFPAPLLFTGVQFLVQHVLARLALWSGAAERKQKEALSWDLYLRTIVPNGVSTGLDIGLSIFSLVYITLSFYTMCKATTPLFLLAFAIAWGLERLSWPLAGVVGTITPGLLLLVHGERNFHLLGFALVMSASAMSGLRWTYTQVQLQGSGGHGGIHGSAIEVMAQLTPIASATVLVLSLLVERVWYTIPASAFFMDAKHTTFSCLLTLGGGLIAFLMVWTEFQVIKFTSALTLMVAGTFKEIVTVLAGVWFFGDEFTPTNGLGLCVVIAGVTMYNVYKYQKMRVDAAVSAHGRRSSQRTTADADELVPLTGEPKHLSGAAIIHKKRLELEAELE